MRRPLMIRDFSPSHSRIRRVFGRGLTICALVCLALLSVLPARAQFQVPAKPAGYVNDYANVLSPTAVTQLTALCTEINDKAKAQIFIVTVKTLGERTKEDYSLDIATKWGVGPKQSSSGVLIFYAIDDRQYFTQIGYGLEPILPDGKVGGFLREAIPSLRAGDYSAAITLVTRRIADVIAQDRGIALNGGPLPAAAPVSTTNDTAGGLGTLLILALIIFFLYMVMKRGGGGTGRGGGSGWWVGPMIGGMLGGSGGGWSGGGGGGGFGGGFGGGGGGSFGGGGAGGSW
jgi:uncharacterized protein